jgi:hemolysin D
LIKKAASKWSRPDLQTAQAQLTAEWSDITARLAKLASERSRR